MIKQEQRIYIAEYGKCGRAINTGLKSLQQVSNYLSRAVHRGHDRGSGQPVLIRLD